MKQITLSVIRETLIKHIINKYNIYKIQHLKTYRLQKIAPNKISPVLPRGVDVAQP